jgi:hypothetical protein
LRQPERLAAAAGLSGAVDVERLRSGPRRPEHPNLFMRVFGDGPAAGTADDLWWLLEQTEPAALPALWLGCGTEDPLYTDNVRFADACVARGVELTVAFTKGEHDWALWDEQIQRVLAWLPLGRNGTAVRPVITVSHMLLDAPVWLPRCGPVTDRMDRTSKGLGRFCLRRRRKRDRERVLPPSSLPFHKVPT